MIKVKLCKVHTDFFVPSQHYQYGEAPVEMSPELLERLEKSIHEFDAVQAEVRALWVKAQS